MAFINACLLSNWLREEADLPNCAAYCSTASSRRTIIPNSSRISGSSLIAPLVNLSNASAKSLPSAKEAPFAISASPVNSFAPNPPETPKAAPLEACSSDSAPSVASLRLSARTESVLPDWLPTISKPCCNCWNSAALDRALKAAEAAKTLAARVA